MERVHDPGRIRKARLVLALGGAFFAGLVLQLWIGKLCLLRHTLPLSAQLAWSLPLAIWLMVLCRAQTRSRFPTAWVRWLFAPFAVLCMAGFLIFAVRGWVVCASYALASQWATIELPVVGVDRPSGRGTLCRHVLKVRHEDDVERLCAQDVLVGRSPRQNEAVIASGWVSPLGFHVLSLRAR